MGRFLFFFFLLILSIVTHAQQRPPFDRVAVQRNYDSAFAVIKAMLDKTTTSSFKRAVFVTENAYRENKLSYSKFDSDVQRLVKLCKSTIDRGGFIYNERDKAEVSKYWSVFMVMKNLHIMEKDTVKGSIRKLTPFNYDFNDFWGEEDWTNMFVHKLMKTNTGNCHSLPFLYKILCEDLGAKAYLAMAPNHIYIKHYSRKNGWYNTELTSGQFPIDAWIMASGYVHLSAIQNGVYMDTLSSKQSLAVCVTDLAKGYERKFGEAANPEFIQKCVDLSLKYYPNYVNALILKAEIEKKKFEKYIVNKKAEYPSDVFSDPEAKAIYDNMEKLYFSIHQLGYRMMPKEMYESWLLELSKEREKYSNKIISKEFSTTNK